MRRWPWRPLVGLRVEPGCASRLPAGGSNASISNIPLSKPSMYPTPYGPEKAKDLLHMRSTSYPEETNKFQFDICKDKKATASNFSRAKS